MRILYVTEMVDAPFRYRVAHAIEQLRGAGHSAVAVGPGHSALPQGLRDYDILILYRLPYSPQVEAILEAAREHGVVTAFDCDDLIFFEGAHHNLHFLCDLSEHEQAAYVDLTQRLDRTARGCGVVLASTPAIAAQAASMGLRALIHRNVLSAFQERQARWLHRFRRWTSGVPLLGYFSGSNTHDQDFHSIYEPLVKVFERNSDAHLLIVGHLKCPRFADRFRGRVWQAPYMPWREYPAMMARCRALLAPVAELSAFTDAKSALKFFEPGVLGVPVVASPIAEMREAVVDGDNGWLARTPDEWDERLTAALSPGLAAETGQRARRSVLARYTASSQGSALADLLAGLLAGAPERPRRLVSGLAAVDNAEHFRQRLGRWRRMARYLFAPPARWARQPEVAPAPPAMPAGVGAAPEKAPRVPTRGELANRYLRGVGIEIGALQNPLPVPPEAKVRYVDVLSRDEARKHFPELGNMALVDPEIIDNAQTLSTIADASFDFAIQNHVLEHVRNPLGALRNWLRVLRPGGVAYVAIPDRSNKLDHARPVTQFEHLLLDDQGSDRPAADHAHYVEWAVHVNGRAPGADAEARAAELEVLNYNIHFHVFDERLFRDVLAEACRAQSAEIVEFVPHDDQGALEFISILRKLPPLGQLRRPVSIVMPIYNAFDKTVRACETVLRHATGDWELIAVDDASPDKRIVPYLSALAARDKRIRVVTNAANAGFVITANCGMRHARAEADVLLLNSDVEVTEGFLRRIQDAAFVTADTGIVTPFSNNATICSLPEANQDNVLPQGFSVDDMQGLVSSASPCGHPELPTGVGFCMYVRREVLAQVGLFDEVAYGRGFGEENDLCERAKKAGFKLRICDSQFIYHAGKSSFGAEGHALSKKNSIILEAQHPGYHAAVARFCEANPLLGTRMAFKAHLRRWPCQGDPAVMFLLHADPFRKAAGGTEAHVLDRIAHLALKRALIVFPDSPQSITAAEVLDGAVANPLYFSFPLQRVMPPYSHRHPEAEDVLVWIAGLFGVRALCIDHLLAWPLNAVSQLRAAGVPYLYVNHDFYAVCPSLNLLNSATWRPCAVHFGGRGDSEACLREHFSAYHVTPPCDFKTLLADHRAFFTSILQNAAGIVFPSESSRETVVAAYSLDRSRTTVLPHGYKHPGARPPSPAPAPVLKVALIGAVAYPIKGSDIILDTIGRTRHLPIEWHVFGDAEPFYFAQRIQAASPRVVLHGGYEREQIVPLLVSTGMDVALFTSVCPETFAFTLSEAYCAGVPPIVPRMGALCERVQASGLGWIIEPHSAAAAAKILERLALEPAMLDDMRDALRGYVHMSVEENAAGYRRLLEPLMAQGKPTPRPPLHLLSRAVEHAVANGR